MAQATRSKKVCLILDEPSIKMLERLQKYYGFKSKSDVIRLALARLYEELLVKKVIGEN